MQQPNFVTQIGNYSYCPYQVLGQGATSTVYRGYRNIDKLPVAVKTIRLQQVDSPVKKNLLEGQVKALRAIRDKYICQCYDILKDHQFYFIPLQFCPNGALNDYIRNKGVLSETQAIQLFQKIVEGYCAVRKAGYIHRDVKSQNILLRANFQPVIIDFGYCADIITQGIRQAYNVGSPAYMSPQAYNQNMYSEKSDIWSLGVILHEMLTGKIPFWQFEDPDWYFKDLIKRQTAQLLPIKNKELQKIILSTLSIRLQKRPTAEQLKNMIKSFKRNGSSGIVQNRVQSNHHTPKKNYAMNGQNTLNIVSNTQQITGNSQIIYINKNPSISSNMSNFTNKNYSSNSQNYYQNKVSSQTELPSGNFHNRILTNNNTIIQVQPHYQQKEVYTPQFPKPNPYKNQQQQLGSLNFIPIVQHTEPARLKRNYSSNHITLVQPH